MVYLALLGLFVIFLWAVATIFGKRAVAWLVLGVVAVVVVGFVVLVAIALTR
jgi:uncharacterized membrane protein